MPDEEKSRLAKENTELFFKLEEALKTVERLKTEIKILREKANKNGLVCQVTISEEKLEDIKNSCLDQIEYNIKEIQNEAIKEVLLTLEAEAESSDKYIREYDDSEVQRAYNKALWKAYNLVKEMTETPTKIEHSSLCETESYEVKE